MYLYTVLYSIIISRVVGGTLQPRDSKEYYQRQMSPCRKSLTNDIANASC